MTVDYELAKTGKKAQLDAGSVTAAGPVGAGKKKHNKREIRHWDIKQISLRHGRGFVCRSMQHSRLCRGPRTTARGGGMRYNRSRGLRLQPLNGHAWQQAYNIKYIISLLFHVILKTSCLSLM